MWSNVLQGIPLVILITPPLAKYFWFYAAADLHIFGLMCYNKIWQTITLFEAVAASWTKNIVSFLFSNVFAFMLQLLNIFMD